MVAVRFVIPRMGCCLLICFNDFLIITFYSSFLLSLLSFPSFLFLSPPPLPPALFLFENNHCKFLLGHIFHEIKLSKFFLLLETRDETLAPQT